MKSRDPLEIRISNLSVDGCGYSEDQQKAVYGALPGELVTALPIAKKRKRHYFRAIEIADQSPDRVNPECAVADICGGCSFQHVNRETQLRLKQGRLEDEFSPLVPKNWLAPIAAAAYGYRTKARLGVKYVQKKERVLVGFREKHKPYITDTPSCPILYSTIQKLLKPLANLVSELSISSSVPQIEVAAGDTEVAIIIRHLEATSDIDLEKVSEFGRNYDVVVFLQPAGIDSIWKLYPKDDSDFLQFAIPEHDLDIRFEPQDFTQVNLNVNRLMIAAALELLALESDDVVLDAFCGIGNFSLPIAKYAGQVIGLEQSESSIERAKMNASRNSIQNTQFRVADLHVDEPRISDNTDIFSSVNKVLLDPPRSGAEQLVKILASSNVGRVVYVSCNPETLARDAKLLVEQGFELQSAGIIDMFPHTTHIESIALFQRLKLSDTSSTEPN